MYFFYLFIPLLIIFFLGALFDAPWVPTKKNDFVRIAEIAKLKPGMLFYDLGSGTGEMLFYLSQKYNVHCVGIEISPILYLYSKIKSLFFKNVEILYGNFYKYNLSKADIIYAFLMPKTFNKFKRKMIKELKRDSKIIISCWPLQNSTPIQVDKKNNQTSYYLYNKTALSE